MGPYKVYVGNLPGHFGSEDLSDEFSHIGPIENPYVVRFPNGQSKKFGFLRFNNARAQQDAIAELNGTWISGHQVFVEEANEQDSSGDNWHFLEFDGASRGNPGPAAVGAVLWDSESQRVDEVSEYLGPNFTNNQAEYRALILGLEMALSCEVERLEIRGDSQLVIRQLQGNYEVRSRHLRKLYNKVQRLCNGFEERPLFFHISRNENEEADGLANKALDRAMSCSESSESASEDDYYSEDDYW